MCALIVLRDVNPDYPLLVATNRDESWSRESSSPQWFEFQRTKILAPKDLKAGGTWLGINQRGLLAAVTNRPALFLDETRRSRGLLLQDVLTQPNLASAQKLVDQERKLRPYNPFNLFLSTVEKSVLGYSREEQCPMEWVEIETGIHILTNEHDLNELIVPELEFLLEEAEHYPAVLEPLQRILADHTDREGHTLCKHGRTRGTRSSSFLALPGNESLPVEFFYSPGPPCKTPYQKI